MDSIYIHRDIFNLLVAKSVDHGPVASLGLVLKNGKFLNHGTQELGVN
jgi:hypothetical protein